MDGNRIFGDSMILRSFIYKRNVEKVIPNFLKSFIGYNFKMKRILSIYFLYNTLKVKK